MIGTRIRLRITAMIEGVPLMNEIIEISPPSIKAKTQTINGQFIDSEVVTGFEKLEWSIKIQGSQVLVLKALGRAFTETAHISILDAGKTQDNVPYAVTHDIHGPITSIDEEPVKQGDMPTTTISGTAQSYKKTDSGLTMIDIDTRTGEIDLGSGDIFGLYGIISR